MKKKKLRETFATCTTATIYAHPSMLCRKERHTHGSAGSAGGVCPARTPDSEADCVASGVARAPRCRANVEQISQPRPDSGLGLSHSHFERGGLGQACALKAVSCW